MVKIANMKVAEKIYEYLGVVKQHYNIEQVYLFGSYATGKATDESDIDLALISSAFSKDGYQDNVKLATLTWGIDTRIEPKAFTPEVFEELLLGREIKKTGIKIPIN